ncbi:MAG TPA: hypothetical protein VGN77_06575, partial [Steroidobacteraceae bacterium]|nr:hypothetical protein [Steroidobacteraceae bacterium]
ALAMVHFARAKRVLGDPDAAKATAAEALRLLEQRRSMGDNSESDTIALALAYVAQAQVMEFLNDPNAIVDSQRAAALLQPLVQTPNSTVAARRAYVETLVRLGFEQLRNTRSEDSALSLQLAAKQAADLGARDLSDFSMAAYYAEANAWRVEALLSLGRTEEAKRVAEDAAATADKVLAQRPGYRLALHAQQLLVSDLATIAMANLNPAEALGNAQRAVQISLTILDFDPGNLVTTNNLSVARTGLGDVFWTAGKVREALPYYDQSLKDALQIASGGSNLVVTGHYTLAYVVWRHAQLGEFAAAGAAIDSGKPYLAKLRQTEPRGSTAVTFVDMLSRAAVALVAQQRGDDAAARRIAGEISAEALQIKLKGGIEAFQKNSVLFFVSGAEGPAAYAQKDYAGAEKALRAGLAARNAMGSTSQDDHRQLGTLSTWLAMAVARQGRTAEAAKLIAPVVQLQRGLAARNHGDAWVPVELGFALYAQALTDRAKSPALLHEAAVLLDSVPAEMRDMHDIRLVRGYISAERTFR